MSICSMAKRVVPFWGACLSACFFPGFASSPEARAPGTDVSFARDVSLWES
jgi:hypothetical protein